MVVEHHPARRTLHAEAEGLAATIPGGRVGFPTAPSGSGEGAGMGGRAGGRAWVAAARVACAGRRGGLWFFCN
jgi:hypothetical protein